MTQHPGLAGGAAMALIAACVIVACNQPVSSDSSGPTVYTAGYYYSTASTLQPCYWEGTTKHDLPLLPAATDGAATALVVEGNEIWVAGWCRTAPSADNHPVVWHNGSCQELGDLATSAIPTSIALYDGSSWLAGYFSSASDSYPCYWSNTTPHDLDTAYSTIPSTTGMATGISMEGGTPRISGTYMPSTGSTACYWEIIDLLDQNGTRHDLPAATGSACEGRGIAVSGSTVYVSGYYSESPYTRGCYWKGTTTRVALPGYGWHDSWFATGICVADGIVYTAGSCETATDGPAGFWTDTAITNLQGGDTGTITAEAIAVAGGLAYVAGSYVMTAGGIRTIPCYWKEGALQALPAGDQDKGAAQAIFLVE